jgi:tetratricopeptide (TPR) repeat protein
MPDAEKYVRSVAALEAVGDFESAAAGYYAATERWPEEPMAWLGLGNASYAQGDPGAAERAYKRLLAIDSGHAAALNNLAQVQADRGCYEDAVATLNIALSAAEPNTAMFNIVKAAHQKIESRESATACL